MAKDLLIATLACVWLAAACGGKRPVEVRSEPPPRAAPAEREDAEREDGGSGDAERAAPRSEESADVVADPGAGTPQRRASEHLVREGVSALESGDVPAAARRLEEAIRVDGSNGSAYYHLARARIEAGGRTEARGLLERAIELLRPYPERRAEAERLLERL